LVAVAAIATKLFTDDPSWSSHPLYPALIVVGALAIPLIYDLARSLLSGRST
jgi:hypothetical protein